MSPVPVQIVYLICAVLFILGLKRLSRPRTAVAGNQMGAAAMLLAVVVTLLDRQIVSYEIIIAGLITGAAAGILLAVKIKMTAMPQLVGLFNGLGGGTSALVAGAALLELVSLQGGSRSPGPTFIVATSFSGIVGAVTFWGSVVAFGKLQGFVTGKAVQFSGQNAVKLILLMISLGLGGWLFFSPMSGSLYWAMLLFSSLLGVFLVIAIGGADMPVVIALLNSYSGLAAAATGFVLANNLLIISGSLVGAAGLILTNIMCKAMNRSLRNVLFGGVGRELSVKADEEEMYAGKVKSATAEEIAMMLDGAGRVVVVPGYGMAVAQAQHAVRDLMNLLEARGSVVEFAIHPVAGRMPGHMNVLLAEADIPYEKLKEMDEINTTMEQVDVAIVLGANDVVNPLARSRSDTPLAGMPIIDVDKARTVIVLKRSLGAGFSGVPNPLFAADNTLMYYGDGKEAILNLIAALKET
ncbi:MAG: NAD synthetase [Deltaproteobacteria bacterium HGW-Deltaproteobacteria-21]|nr:MAG: NAD synthetase [Deltaproteobacteria bacterium HGW-Deltaproteobacteria-21]